MSSYNNMPLGLSGKAGRMYLHLLLLPPALLPHTAPRPKNMPPVPTPLPQNIIPLHRQSHLSKLNHCLLPFWSISKGKLLSSLDEAKVHLPHKKSLKYLRMRKMTSKSRSSQCSGLRYVQIYFGQLSELTRLFQTGTHPILIPLDGRSSTIGDMLGLFNQDRSHFKLYLPESELWAPVTVSMMVILHRGEWIALRRPSVKTLTIWEEHVTNVKSGIIEYI